MTYDDKSHRPTPEESKIMRTFRIPLRAVFYREGNIWFAHCLEMDLVGDGPSPEEALRQLSEAISIQIHSSIEHRNMANLFQPADAKFFEMFAAGRDFATGELAIPRLQDIKGVQIDRIDTREYDDAGADRDFACV